MYQASTLKNLVAKANTLIAKYGNMPTQEIGIVISEGNQKIGKTMNVSTMPIIACGNCAQCSKYCYDIKACLQYPGTLDARVRNTVLATYHPAEYFAQIRAKLARRKTNKYFRWHVAGDILNAAYFAEMVQIAKEFPEFTFWTYTKMYHLVNGYCTENGGRYAIPANLHIMFSEWRGMPMVNPYNFPEFRVVFKDDEIKPIGFYCPGNCDICKASNRGCLAGETTYVDEH